MWIKSLEIALGLITIILFVYVSKNVLNIDITTKYKTQINSYAEGVRIVRLTSNATQIVNADYVQYIGSTIFAKNVSLLNKGSNEFVLNANSAYIYKNNDASLIGNCTAKGKNFTIKTQKVFWDNANSTLASNTNTQLFSPKIDITKSDGFVYNKKTNILVVNKADVWIK